MKRIFLACFLITATCTATFIQPASAQSSATVSASSFTTQVDLMDAQIAAGNMTAAQTTWTAVHTMMLTELGMTKNRIAGAATPEDKTAAVSKMHTQRELYKTIWTLKTDLATNRAALHTQLGLFTATF